MTNYLSRGLFAAALFVAASPAVAATVVDQSQLRNGVPFSFLGVNNGNQLTQQSFVAGFGNSVGAGFFLSDNRAYAQTGTLTVTLYSGRPTAGGQALASASVQATGGQWNDAFWSQVSLVAGQTYWLAGQTDTAMVVTSSSGNPYANGDLYYGESAFSSFDLAFRTYANDAVSAGVPEPATWALMMLGFGAMGFALRRGKTATAARIRLA